MHDRAISIRDAVLEGNLAASQKHLGDIIKLDKFYQDSAVVLDRLYGSKKGENPEELRLLEAIKTIERQTLDLTAQCIALLNADNYVQARGFLLSQVSP